MEKPYSGTNFMTVSHNFDNLSLSRVDLIVAPVSSSCIITGAFLRMRINTTQAGIF
jgi:hypothetical protein